MSKARAGMTGVEHATLRGQAAGGDTRYTISLRGGADERWVRAYRALQEESAQHRGFRLDPPTATISFSCRTVEGPTQVFEMLERLESLLALVNERVQSAGAEGGGTSPQAAFHSFV